jgi:hyperosmotically inducible protein
MIKQVLSFLLLAALVIGAVPAVCAANKAISDDLIYDNVKRKLATDPIVKGGGLEVEVKEGAVTLKGKLDSEKRKEKAEKLARKVKGVTGVENQIQVVQK